MKSSAFCPITEEKIDERITRLNALFSVAILLVSAFTQSLFLLLFLWIDFLLRAINLSRYSLLASISRTIVRYFPAGKYINAGPKIFAARVGVLFISLVIISYLLNYKIIALIFWGALTMFCFLEGAFGICVACIIYPYIYRFVYKRNYTDM